MKSKTELPVPDPFPQLFGMTLEQRIDLFASLMVEYILSHPDETPPSVFERMLELYLINTVAAIRVSSVKHGMDGDSPKTKNGRSRNMLGLVATMSSKNLSLWSQLPRSTSRCRKQLITV